MQCYFFYNFFQSFLHLYFRVCKLYFHLEDDSISIVEPSQQNSGMTQGRIVRRHQVPFRESIHENDEEGKVWHTYFFLSCLNILHCSGRRHMASKFVTMWDLNVGVDINIYGKMFKLVDCDNFTRHFLSCQGVKVPSEIPIPLR